jgi:hypothetical protein
MGLRRSQLAAVLLLGCSAATGLPALSCDVPVFRYALERWPAAPYEVFVLHRGPLSAEDCEITEALSAADDGSSAHANLSIHLADIAPPEGAPLERLWEEAGEPNLPCLILRYPRESGIDRIAWSSPLTRESAAALLDSPARRQISRRILDGHSAVWVLLTSGDAAKDAAAKALLERSLRKVERILDLPAPVAGTLAEQPSPPDGNAPDLQIRFSSLVVPQADPTESVLVGMLLRSEPDLGHYADEPMAFPVYGRGRALYALVGAGLIEENISEACEFLVGPCFCEAKALSPGTDVLLATDWDSALEGRAAQAVAEQPLVGLSILAEAASRSEASEPALDAVAVESAPAREESPPGLEGASRAQEASAPVSGAVEGVAASASGAPVRTTQSSIGDLPRNLLAALGALLAVVLFLVIHVSRKAARQRP